MKRSSWIAGFLVLLSLFVISGCYTVLRHPTGESVVHVGSYYRTCADCHADAPFYHPYYTYGWSHYRWRDYYGYPWWYDDYWWYPHDHDDYDGGPEVERGQRHLWGNSGWATKGWGFTSPSPAKARERAAASEEGKAPEQKTEEREAKKDEKKDRPHVWTKKKKGF